MASGCRDRYVEPFSDVITSHVASDRSVCSVRAAWTSPLEVPFSLKGSMMFNPSWPEQHRILFVPPFVLKVLLIANRTPHSRRVDCAGCVGVAKGETKPRGLSFPGPLSSLRHGRPL